jgi:protein SCO1/2
MLLGVKYRREASGDYSHSNLITVLNREGEIAHQREGLRGEIAPTAQAITLAAR